MRTAPALLIGALVALTLVACVPDDEAVKPDPSPTATPIFSSDEEALAAAEEAYAAYVLVSDVVLQEGGSNPERALEHVTDGFREEAASGFELFADHSWRAEGVTAFDSVELQQYSEIGGGAAQISIYLCLDVSQTRILDETGTDVTPASRDTRLPLVVDMVSAQEYSSELLQAGSEVWSGNDFCG
jgi:hypothetical protein